MADIMCSRCGKKLAVDTDGTLEVKNGGTKVRVYGAVAVAVECSRCGQVMDLPRKVPLKKAYPPPPEPDTELN
ncbi:MAG: hypothetical protein KJ604_20605 [Gammaproteobacteria bacterium]|nr:hypothetical protein [Gammaproteobacteria bacterium]